MHINQHIKIISRIAGAITFSLSARVSYFSESLYMVTESSNDNRPPFHRPFYLENNQSRFTLPKNIPKPSRVDHFPTNRQNASHFIQIHKQTTYISFTNHLTTIIIPITIIINDNKDNNRNRNNIQHRKYNFTKTRTKTKQHQHTTEVT